MPFLQTLDLNIHYEQAGSGDTHLVLIHGNFASWRWWQPVFDRLPPGWRAYAPDLRGCGDTDRPDRGYTVEQLAVDLHHFTGALNLSPLHLVGHSLGGAVALQFALDWPERVRSLTLVAPSPAEGMPFSGADPTGPAWLRSLFNLERNASLAGLAVLHRLLRAGGMDRRVLRQALARMLPTLSRDELDALVNDAARMAPQAVAGFVRALDTWNVESRLDRVDVPVAILVGGKDRLVPRSGLARTAERLARGRLVVWPDVGHAPQFERPGDFVRFLSDFIEENADTPEPARAGRARRFRDWLRLSSRSG
jgi:pimeloyl-ACP methyl ester carboxylesterase